MNVSEAIENRRAYRSLEPIAIPGDWLEDLARCAALAPSCFNKQPWRFIFVRDPGRLAKLAGAMKSGNEWTARASMIIAVCTQRELDCVMKDGREYALFDVGLATAFLILRATELGLVAHPIAGYDPAAVRQALEIPEGMTVVTLVIVGKRAAAVDPQLPDWAQTAERERPERLPLKAFAFADIYQQEMK